MRIQLQELFDELDKLQQIHGDKDLNAIYGGGCVKNAKYMFILMNPTGKNLSALKTWSGKRLPWVGTKNIFKLLSQLDLIDKSYFDKTRKLKSTEWDHEFAEDLYSHFATKGLYLTSLAKCTQIDARPLNNSVFKDYIDSTYKEMLAINPKHIFTFGNQVSSVLLSKPIKVSDYQTAEYEEVKIAGKSYRIHPTYYPVGQGMRNMDLAVKRIKTVVTQTI